MDHKLSMNALMIALSLGALVCMGAFALYGAWIDGRRQKLRDHGGRPTTWSDGSVHEGEGEHEDGDERR